MSPGWTSYAEMESEEVNDAIGAGAGAIAMEGAYEGVSVAGGSGRQNIEGSSIGTSCRVGCCCSTGLSKNGVGSKSMNSIGIESAVERTDVSGNSTSSIGTCSC
jgi:hypothetical protein